MANAVYDMALRGQAKGRVWAYRKAAWTIEDTEQDLGLIYRVMGRKGLESIESVGPKRWLKLSRLCCRNGCDRRHPDQHQHDAHPARHL